MDNLWTPLTYTLLPNEDTATLKTAFTQIRYAAEKHGAGFANGFKVMFDYDGHLREAYKEAIGYDHNHTYRGCTFHFSQRILDYVNSNGMMGRYRDEENEISYLKEEDLPFVLDDLRSIFKSLKKKDPRTYKFFNEVCGQVCREILAEAVGSIRNMLLG